MLLSFGPLFITYWKALGIPNHTQPHRYFPSWSWYMCTDIP